MDTPAKAGREIFRFLNCWIDVDRVREMMAAGEIAPELDVVPIVGWAEGILRLDRKNPTARPASMMIRLNHDHVATLTAEHLKEPVMVVQARHGTLIFDGNHRVGRGYLDGLDDLPAYFFMGELGDRITQYAQPRTEVREPRSRSR